MHFTRAAQRGKLEEQRRIFSVDTNAACFVDKQFDGRYNIENMNAPTSSVLVHSSREQATVKIMHFALYS